MDGRRGRKGRIVKVKGVSGDPDNLQDTEACQKSRDKDIKNASLPIGQHMHTCMHPLFPARSCWRLKDLKDAKRCWKSGNKDMKNASVPMGPHVCMHA